MADHTNAQRLRSWGRSRFESQPAPVVWAGQVLRGAHRYLGAFPEVDDAMLLTETQERWPQAREVFDRLRRRGLDQDAPLTVEQTLLFALVELAAKVAHNAAGMQPPFDDDAGWRIGPPAYRLISVTEDPRPQAELTVALGAWPEDN